MFEDLVQTIETLQKRIKNHRNSIEDYEARTRTSLIDPLLHALGWDVADPAIVEIEPKVANGWADYSLLNSGGKPVMLIEAKKLADKNPPVQQTIGYAVSENMTTNSKVRYCACTNGDTWVVYDLIEQNPVMELSITTESAPKCALRFLGLWQRSLSGGDFDTAIEPIFEPQRVAVKEKESIAPPDSIGWVPLNGDFSKKGTPHPTLMRLPDGTEIATKSWRSVMVQTFLWLYQAQILTQENCRIPFLPGRKRCIASVDGRHLSGTPFKAPLHLGNTGIILEGNLSLADLTRNIETVLVRFGQDPAKVLLKLS